MALALRKGFKGLIDGMGRSTQLHVQGAAVTPVTYTAAGPIAEADNVVDINSAGASRALTIDRPRPGRLLVITQIDAGSHGHTVTLGAGTFDGTNSVATFDAQYEALVLLGISDTRFLILKNYGGVGLS